MDSDQMPYLVLLMKNKNDKYGLFFNCKKTLEFIGHRSKNSIFIRKV
ncbi:hypothetical protein DDB_G0292050 [Dictyostelium discoideum AX4]|uniref:Uncharacterized protein n=1 Tax=Dictyostelium discoideum TaxID=44689 RepID=Q54DS9_DICDI|nr:hypothetical protein DDB_G0292050 [Dictyostelium discoideum AX4]EAL61381.1 hypothetical protein DDB_G0292050 [Dictyostelium discoideum AX4]|eukprot:XP_629793.1 hypothetical protein DDB_G0292050 [Dictyostelium discoideum AX4]